MSVQFFRLTKNLHQLLASCVVCTGCSGPTEIAFGPEPPPAVQVEKVFVATSRTPADAPAIFGGERNQTINYDRFDVSVPPDREDGKINAATPGRTPETAREYYVADRIQYPDRAAFRSAVASAIRNQSPDERAVAVFVHGFNNTFADGLYRNAQIAADFDIPAVQVNYSWPSAGRAKLYLYDRDSAFFARDGLEELLNTLAETGARRIILYAHSMGAQVTVEAVRQMAIRGDPAVFAKLHSVTLLSADVDVDLFKREAAAVRGRNLPWYIFVSSKDKALKISSVLRGGSERLGSVENPDDIAGTNATLIDLSEVRNEDPFGHETVAESPAMIAIIKGYNEQGRNLARQEMASHGLVRSTVNSVGNVSEIVLSPVGQ